MTVTKLREERKGKEGLGRNGSWGVGELGSWGVEKWGRGKGREGNRKGLEGTGEGNELVVAMVDGRGRFLSIMGCDCHKVGSGHDVGR